MAINYTATSAINAWLTTTDADGDTQCEYEVTLLAFGWADTQPETTTGIWVLGAATGGLKFIPARALMGLTPRPSHVESALLGIKEEAAEAQRVASDLQLRFDEVMPGVRAAEGLAVGGMAVAGEAKEEAEVVEAKLEKVEAKLEKVEGEEEGTSIAVAESTSGSRQGAAKASASKTAESTSGSRQRAAKASASKTTRRAPVQHRPKAKTPQPVG